MAAIAAWDEACRIAAYFASTEAELESLPQAEADLVRERLRLARSLVSEIDPLALLKAWKAPLERLPGST